jgi:hypothetical protein
MGTDRAWTDIPAVPPGIFDSIEALDAYLEDVRERRDRRRRDREQRRMLERAIEKVLAEIAESQQPEDAEIAEELQAVLREFQERMRRLTVSQRAVGGIPGAEEQPAEAAPEASQPTEPARPQMTEEEEDALVQPLLARIERIADEWRRLDEREAGPNGETLARNDAFRIRALVCALGAVLAEAFEQGVQHRIEQDVLRLRDQIAFGRVLLGDEDYCMLFAEEMWNPTTGGLPSEAWADLERLYLETADAQEIYAWYVQTCDVLSVEQRRELLNGIAAVQQRLFRRLKQHSMEDKLQGGLYRDLLDNAKSEGFLSALHAQTSDAKLAGWARALPDTFANLQNEVKRLRELQAKREACASAIDRVLEWHREVSERELTADQIEAEASRVHALLDACIAAGVPPTNREVRGALLEWGPVLLEDQPKYAKILEAVLAERKRQGIDQAPTEEEEHGEDDEGEPTETAAALYKATIAPFVAHKRVLILGGQPRERVCDELKETLDLADARWLPSKASDKAGKFEAEIKKADILLLAKNFAGHDMSEKGREWIRSVGGHFIYLPSGYGVNQIVFQLYKYVNAKDTHT